MSSTTGEKSGPVPGTANLGPQTRCIAFGSPILIGFGEEPIGRSAFPGNGLRTRSLWTWLVVCLGLECWNPGISEGWPEAGCPPVISSFQCFLIPSSPGSLLASLASGRGRFDDEGLEQIATPQGQDPIAHMREFWQRWGRVCTWIAAGFLLVAALLIINPFRIYDSLNERLLQRSLLSVDDLLKRIQEEAEATSEDSQNSKKEETVVEEGLLGGLAEVADFTNAEQVPAYVLTVNDLMLDNIRVTLKRLRRFTEGNVQRYRDYLFSVLKGIKTLTEQSAEAGVSAGLAVDIHAYFADDKRYQAWRKLLGRAAKRGRHREIAQGFLLFMRDIREDRDGRLTVARLVSWTGCVGRHSRRSTFDATDTSCATATG